MVAADVVEVTKRAKIVQCTSDTCDMTGVELLVYYNSAVEVGNSMLMLVGLNKMLWWNEDIDMKTVVVESRERIVLQGTFSEEIEVIEVEMILVLHLVLVLLF